MTLSFAVVSLVAVSSVAIFARLKPDAGAEVLGPETCARRCDGAGGVTGARRARRETQAAASFDLAPRSHAPKRGRAAAAHDVHRVDHVADDAGVIGHDAQSIADPQSRRARGDQTAGSPQKP